MTARVDELRRWGRMSPEQHAEFRAECARLYTEEELSVREIVVRTQRSYGSVHQALRIGRVPMRSPGRPRGS